MAETETQNEHTLPTKRKLDDDPIPENNQEQENHSNKSQKLESLTNNSPITQEKNTDNAQALETSMDKQNGTEAEEDEEEEEEDGDYEDEEENGEEVVVDRKGKGILIEEDEDDSDDDGGGSSGDGSEFEGGDDSEEAEEDDPLAEVDLGNILPSRTRRKVVRPGVYIAKDNLANDDDNSDDSDA